MTIDLSQPTIYILKDVSEKLFSEAPKYFKSAIACTDKNFIYSDNIELIKSSFSAKKIMKDYFNDNPYSTRGISMSFDDSEQVEHPIIFGIKDEEMNDTNNKENALFYFLHEAMHVSKLHEIENKSQMHYHETFADTGAYLLFAREVGTDSEFLKSYPFSRARHILAPNSYKLKGTYYTTDAMLAAKHVIDKIDVAQLSYEGIKNISEIIANEFASPQQTLNRIHNKLIKNTRDINLALETALSSNDQEIYKIARHFSLSNTFKESATKPYSEDELKLKDIALEITLDPILDKIARKRSSLTERAVKKLISRNPCLAMQ